ncbi:hypothetical protein ACFROC_18250 [Nocardia tengchongensis]|uniref:hypothetical protein n=1 Tax=Nocardia tengchongensis TaxID=2055889 RepID=UPI0036840E1B
MWTAPTALIGFQRAATLEHFDPGPDRGRRRCRRHLQRSARAGVKLWAGSRLVAPAAIATLPEWMRVTGGFDQAAVLDAAYPPAVRAAMSALKSDRLKPAVARHGIGQMTGRLLAEHMRAGVPVNPVTVTPQQAKALYGRKSSSSA